MNKSEWLKFIRHSTEAHHIREIFNGTYTLIGLPEVQKQFFSRIDYLLGLRISEHTRSSLENLREDIEDEIETGNLQKVAGPAKESKSPYVKPVRDNTEKLRTAMRILEEMKIEIQRIQKLVGQIIEEDSASVTQ